MADTAWVEHLPRSMRLRFDGLGGYTKAILSEAEMLDELRAPQVRQIQTVVFLKSLEQFLRDGTEAAASAVDQFQQLGVPGFRVGGDVFAERNDAVMRGSRLADGLRGAIRDPEVLDLLSSNLSLREIIIKMGRRFSAERR
ncbi:MAG TPA: hypothetical protein VF665_22710 [Longimicrobium sp.]|jgi:hypothetical protein|uniref:hypothetical protein n=1 Tax=Longimicrobium sp. TaxID=2029185 RepID=UPI002EDB2168